MAVNTANVVFPSTGHQVLSTLVHLIGCSLLAFCFGRRITWRKATVSSIYVMAIFVDSWLFVFSGGVLVSGVGMSLNENSCLSGIYLCIIFYASSKILIYLYLAEKVRRVWSVKEEITARFRSKIWLGCFIVLFGYIAIFILMLIARVGYIRPDNVCVIGLGSMASIPLLSYDVFLNIFLTGLFVWPLMRKRIKTTALRSLAKRTCWAAAVALGTSVINILILTLLHGHQLGWVCLASCGFDVTVNAVVIFIISRKSDSSEPRVMPPQVTTRQERPRLFPSQSLNPTADPFSKAKLKVARPTTTQPTLRSQNLERIGDFAITRDDGGQYTAGTVSYSVVGHHYVNQNRTVEEEEYLDESLESKHQPDEPSRSSSPTIDCTREALPLHRHSDTPIPFQNPYLSPPDTRKRSSRRFFDGWREKLGMIPQETAQDAGEEESTGVAYPELKPSSPTQRV